MDTVTVRTILAPTDFSDGSLEAMRRAVELAEVFSAKVVFLYVMEQPAYGIELSLAQPAAHREVGAVLAEMLREHVERVKAHGIEVVWHLEVGTPFLEIRAAAERYRADLIVMGTHGRTGLAHAVLGSVAERVVQHAPCPVLTVKAPREPSRPPAAAGRFTGPTHSA
jgi:nucleotide-binding universal stress UspA family protein